MLDDGNDVRQMYVAGLDRRESSFCPPVAGAGAGESGPAFPSERQGFRDA